MRSESAKRKICELLSSYGGCCWLFVEFTVDFHLSKIGRSCVGLRGELPESKIPELKRSAAAKGVHCDWMIAIALNFRDAFLAEECMNTHLASNFLVAADQQSLHCAGTKVAYVHNS